MFLDRLTGLNLTDSDSLRANFHSSYFACDRRQLHFRSHRRKFAHAFIEAALEILRNIRVEWIRRQRTVTPVLVHPEPGGGFSGQPARTGPSKLAPFPGATRRREIQSGDEKPRGNARRAAARNGR
jgi:hypothetical protein